MCAAKFVRLIFEESFRKSKKNLPVIIKYARAELGPPKLSEFGAVKEGFSNIIYSAKSGAFKELKIREAFLNSLVAAEVVMWFFVGEIIGRRSIIGYTIKY